MTENLHANCSAGKLEKFIAKAYIFFLTLRMIGPLTFTQSVFHAAATDVDFILHILGIMLILYRNHGKIYFQYDDETYLLKFFGGVVLFLNASSLIMACIMQFVYGSIGSDTAFSAVSGQIIYWFQYLFIFYYNKEIFAFLTKKEIEAVVQTEIWALLVLGYVQIGAMNIGAIAAIYDKLDVFSVFVDSSKMSKLSLTSTEGATGGSIIGIFVIPYLVSGILNKDNKRSEIIQLVLWIPVLYYTNSTAAYLTALSIIPMLLILAGKKGMMSRRRFGGFAVLCVIIFAVYFARDAILNLLPDTISDQLRYLIFEKATDHDNGSTVTRTISFYYNWGAFKEYPLLGVGNGCQGYFYLKYFPSWAMNKTGSDVMVFYHRAEQEILNGSVFFPGILSGYGIVGVILIISYVKTSHSLLKEKSMYISRWTDFYFLACIPIFVRGISTEYAGEYYIWFILSIPYMSVLTEEHYSDISNLSSDCELS